nr:hypothetical protein [Tanacetum cinerariifolium]
DEAAFLAAQIALGPGQAQRLAEAVLSLFHERDERRMNVALARDRRGVAELLHHRREQQLQRQVGLGAGERLERGNAGSPSAEMLGGEIAARGLLDIVVDVGRGDRMGFALIVHPREQMLVVEILHLLDGGGEALVGDRHVALLSRLAL